MSLEWIDGRYDHNELSGNKAFQEIFPGKLFRNAPLGFIDVGARGGVHSLLSPIAEITAVLGFEPDETSCKEVNDAFAAGKTPWASLKVLPVALADDAGEATLHQCTAPTNDSLLPVNKALSHRYKMDKFAQTGQVKVLTQTLDSVLFGQLASENHWGELIKLDTQGTEYEILKGADRTLRERAIALFVEVEFCQIYQDQKLFSELELLLRGYGFSFYGFHSTHERSCKLLDKKSFLGRERLLHADAVFFKDPLPGASARPKLNERGNAVLFTCAMILGYFDFALELARVTFATGATDQKVVEKLINSFAYHDPLGAATLAHKLAEEVTAHPEYSNVAVGRFVDRYRAICNFEDVIVNLAKN